MKKYGRNDERATQVVEIPEIAMKAYGIFMELNGSRTSSGFGMNPISFTEIKSYVDLHNTNLLSWEINVIKHLDSVFLKFISKKG